MSWYATIFRLQEVDLALLHIQQRLGEIETALKNDAELAAAQHASEVKSAAAAAAQTAQKDLEFESGRVRIKLEQTENALYGGRITNARELQDLQAELKSLQRHKATLEDQLLEAMLVCEDAVAAAAAAQETLRQVQEAGNAAGQVLVSEREQLDAQMQGLQGEMQRLKSQIPPDVLDTYLYLKDRTDGIPVARLNGEVCDQCGVEVLRATLRKVKQHEVTYCDSCRRLLVAL